MPPARMDATGRSSRNPSPAAFRFGGVMEHTVRTIATQSLDTTTAANGTLDKAQIRILHGLHTRYAEQLTSAIRELAAAQTVNLASLEEATAVNHLTRHGQPEHVMSFSGLHPHAGRLELYGDLPHAMLNHLLNCHDSRGQQRRMSEIEIQLLNKSIEPLLDLYADCWQDVAAFRLHPEELALSPQAGESLYVATYNVTLADGAGQLVIALRLSAWTEILAQHAQPAAEEIPPLRQNLGMLGAIGDTTLDAHAMLGSTRISIGDYLGLRVGDVICLDQDANAPVEIQVGKRTKLSGQAHIQNGKYVVTIDRFAARGGE